VSARMRPACLPLKPDPVLALLHLSAHQSSTGALVCPPFGWEEMCSYRARLRWAEALADAGYPTVRLGLPSTGDSAGSPSDPGRLEAWTSAVAGTADWLREATSVERVVGIGIGLGGMLAFRAAAQGAAIDDLILWAVPSRGRVLLRELRAYAGMVAARHPDDAKPGSLRDGDLELMGFQISAETAAEVDALELTSLELPNAAQRRVLVLGRDGISVDKRLREHLERSGAEVTVETTSDYGAMMAHPQEAEAPRATIAKTVSWVQNGAPKAPAAAAPPGAPAESECLELSWSGTPIRETPIRFESERGEMLGVLTESVDSEPAPLTGVMLNGGALWHIGPNRTYVEIARRWAARGVPTVRVDLHGIGDSDGDERALLPNRSLYAAQRTEETLAILDQLAARGLPGRFVLGGLCSGAYWSLHAALADARVVGALMINLYAFYWSEALVAERETQESLDALRGSGWRRLVRRDVSFKQLQGVVRSMQPGRIRAGAGHPVERAQRKQIEHVLERLREQGTEALLLLGRGEPLYDQLARQGILNRLDEWPNLIVERIPTRDHMFRAVWLQRYVHESLDRGLERAIGAVPAGQQLPQR
jgi:pimeloyl-ACP methyl ester carboxylesterase